MIHIVAAGIVCAVRQHGETGAIVRALTEDHGLLAGYVQGARGRSLRPVLIAGNMISGVWRGRVDAQLPSLSVEPMASRAHLLGEPLAIAAIDWATALTAATLPEAHPYPALYAALDGLLSAIEYAPSARGWAGAMGQYEELLLAKLGYGEALATSPDMARNRKRLVANLLGEHRRDVMATRERLVDRLNAAGS